MKELPDKIAHSVAQAHQDLVDAQVLATVGSEESITFNRCFHMLDGKLNPDIIKPAGPIDPQVPLVYFQWISNKNPLAVYLNYSVHLDNVGGDLISADLPYTLTETLRKAVG